MFTLPNHIPTTRLLGLATGVFGKKAPFFILAGTRFRPSLQA
jgi:hypothetical protein